MADVVGRLASGAPLGQAATKRAVNAATYAGLDEALERSGTAQATRCAPATRQRACGRSPNGATPDFEGE